MPLWCLEALCVWLAPNRSWSSLEEKNHRAGGSTLNGHGFAAFSPQPVFGYSVWEASETSAYVPVVGTVVGRRKEIQKAMAQRYQKSFLEAGCC